MPERVGNNIAPIEWNNSLAYSTKYTPEVAAAGMNLLQVG
jgi:hypothetical protein